MDEMIRLATKAEADRVLETADAIGLMVEQARKEGCLEFDLARSFGELADHLRRVTVDYLIKLARVQGIGPEPNSQAGPDPQTECLPQEH